MDEKYAEYLHKWSLDVNDVCRLCVNAKNSMKPIARIPQIATLFEDIIGIKFDTASNYPPLICQECEYALDLSAQHIKRMRQVDAFWKRFLVNNRSLSCASATTTDEAHKNNQLLKTELASSVTGCVLHTNVALSHPTEAAFSTNSSTAGHLRHLENEQSTVAVGYICDYCGNQFNTKSKLRCHFKVHLKYDCSMCKKQFSSKTSLSVHAKLHRRTVDDMVRCDVCQKTFIDKGTYRDHVRYTHTDVYDAKCPICDKVYETPKRMRVHMMRHSKEKRFRCTECPKLFMQKQELKVHMRVHTGERPYVCDICGMSFKAMRSLQNHHRSHSSEAGDTITTAGPVQPFMCPICDDKCFAHSATLSKHLKHQHPFEATTLWQTLLQTICIKCNQFFPSIESIQHHNEQLHQRFQCDICKKYFGAEETLRYHVQSHSTQDRRFKCDVCGASFLKNAALQIHHRRTHLNERPHACNICQKKFVSNSDLMGHIKITHNKQKSHVCSVCDKPYPTAGSLRQHEQKHSGVYRYRCMLCDKNFTTSQQFTMHNLRTHKLANEIN